MTGSYDLAQICENGHTITYQLREHPEQGKEFCDQCGARTVTRCPQCNAEIRGAYSARWQIGVAWYGPPRFCPDCGKPYPWTQKAVEEAKKLAALAQKLSQEEQDQLASDIDDLVRDTPRTEGAVARFKLIAPKLGEEIFGALKVILINVASESAKKGLGL